MNHPTPHENHRRETKPPQGVIMPEVIEEPILYVDGDTEYRNNNFYMIIAGVLIICGVFAVLIFIGRFFYGMLFAAFYLIGLGGYRLSQSSKKSPED